MPKMVIRGWARHAAVDWNRVVAPMGMRVRMADLRKLLWEESLADGNTKERFEAWARGDGRDVRFEVDTRIASEMKGGVVPDYNDLDLYDIQKEAEDEEDYRLDNAESLYMGITESLGIHYNMIDDSDGSFWPLFEECMEAMGRCIKRQKLSAEERRRRVGYLASWSVVVFSDFMTYYEQELENLCEDVEDLKVWRGALDAELNAEDIGDRDCYWAANKEQIEKARMRVSERINDASGNA